MPGADFSPNRPQSELTESNLPMPGTEDQTEQEWQTVDFPDAMSVDQLPVVDQAESITPSTPSFLELAPLTQPETEPAEVEQDSLPEPSTEFIQALQQSNQDLIDRVAELEAELDTCQNTLQDKEAILNQQTQKLGLATDQVTRLFGKQELSNQVIQRQQVLVETLTQQWEESQTKMAQMERDCALTQQRYNEQFHELMQTQNICRDLRSRLHRQQRHTLQFKAALERSLEMQSQQRSLLAAKPSLIQPELIKTVSTTPEIKPTSSDLEAQPAQSRSVSKAPPVQPWSIQSAEVDESVEILEEIIQAPDTDPLDFQPTEIESQIETTSPYPPQLEDLETYWHVEPIKESSEYEEASPEAELMENELERIRVEYASLSVEDEENEDNDEAYELDQLESVPQSFSQDRSQSTMQPITESDHGASDSSWPAPLIRPQHQRKLRSLAAIELPKLPKTQSDTPDTESLSMQEFAEIEPF
ncbi:MAG: hypothetical protein WBA77_01500 [Microcoleaceae cyanobacterium]